MQYSWKDKLKVLLVNPAFQADRELDGKTIELTLRVETNNPDVRAFGERFNAVVEHVNNTNFIRVDDAYIIKILEPKAGATVHIYLQALKDHFEKESPYFIRIGDSIPHDTLNGYPWYVLPPGVKPSLEEVGRIVLADLGGEHSGVSLELSTGTFAATVTWQSLTSV